MYAFTFIFFILTFIQSGHIYAEEGEKKSAIVTPEKSPIPRKKPPVPKEKSKITLPETSPRPKPRPAHIESEKKAADVIKEGADAVASGKDLGEKKADPCCDLNDGKDPEKAITKETLFGRSLPFIDENSCKKPANYYLKALKEVPDIIRMPRANYLDDSADIAPACMFNVMKQFPDAPSMMSSCSNNKGKAKRKARKSCATSDYFYSIYNSFIDVTDCLSISQKTLLPKLSNESGLHLNTLGPGGDAGVGQLTSIAVEDSNRFWGKHITNMQASTKPSCQRIAPLLEKMKKTKPGSAQNCNLIAPPENPLKNIFYMGIVSLRNRAIANSSFEANNVEALAIEAGLSKSDILKLKEMVALLGYNAGAGSATIILKNYLAAQIAGVKKDNSISLPKSYFDFSKNTDRVKKLSCKSAVKKIGIKKLTFPEYARACQKAGTKGYLSFVYNAKKNIDAKMETDLCTEKKFLQL